MSNKSPKDNNSSHSQGDKDTKEPIKKLIERNAQHNNRQHRYHLRDLPNRTYVQNPNTIEKSLQRRRSKTEQKKNQEQKKTNKQIKTIGKHSIRKSQNIHREQTKKKCPP